MKDGRVAEAETETAADAPDDELRARVFLRSVLPLVRVVLADRPALRRRFASTTAAVSFEVAGRADLGATLRFERGALAVEPRPTPRAALGLPFRDVAALNAFFAGRGRLPRLRGALRHPLLLARTLGLLAALRLLAPTVAARSAEDRRLRVKLVLYMVTHALSTLNHGGHPDVAALVEPSPDRVYQWAVDGEPDLAAYLRMRRGRTRAGRGTYGRRRPFVLTAFPSVDAAYRVFNATGSQMEAVARGDVRTEGSPEYSRKVGILLQKVDALLTA